jgi:flagellin
MPVISANTTANTAVAFLNANSTNESTAIEEISSGQDTTNAASDPAGMAISTGMNSDVAILQQAAINVTSGESVLNTASGALSNMSDIMTRMQSLAAEAQSGSSSTASLADLNAEFTSLIAEVSNIVNQTTFNGEPVLTTSATYASGAVFLVGDTSSDTISLTLPAVATVASNIGSLAVTSVSSASAAMSELTTEINLLSTYQSSVGAQLEQLLYTGSVVGTTITNLQSASSAITSVDISAEETTYTNEETLTSAAVTAVSDANMMQSELLKVLQ